MAAKRKIGAEARTIGEFFRRPVAYRVPVNQRDFAWTQEEIDTLWGDLTQALEEDHEEYFFGAITVAPVQGESNVFEIVDGQQRLATLSMILAAVRVAWAKDERGQEVFDTYLGAKDRRSREMTPKLTLNATNDVTYQNVVLNCKIPTPTEEKALARSNRLLVSAYRRVKEILANWIKEQGSDEDALIAIEEYIDKNANVIVIEVGDESDAFIIFETLNDRGLELAVSDLVKNYLFSQARKQIELFKRTWAEIAQTVGSENLTAFLRHFWISEYKLLRERDLYRSMRATIKGPTKPKVFLLRLRHLSGFYAALLSPDHPYWADVPGSPQKQIRALRLLRATQFRPLALAVMEGGKPDEVSSLLRILLAVSLRYIIVGASANELERAYSSAAIAVRSSGKRNAKAIIAHLKMVYFDDEDFRDAFARATFTKSDIARYVLGELNRELEPDKASGATEDASLEHVMPRNPGSTWRSLPSPEELPELVERIGNLTLLEKGTNRGMGNKDFRTKQSKGYAKSKLAINETLKTASKWTSAEIDARCRELARVAAKVWRLDLS